MSSPHDPSRPQVAPIFAFAVLASSGYAMRFPVIRPAMAEHDQLASSADADSYSLAVQTDSGHVATVEFAVSGEHVRVLFNQRQTGTLFRPALFQWLTQPSRNIELANEDVTFALSTEAGVVLFLPGVTAAPISRAQVAELRHRISP